MADKEIPQAHKSKKAYEDLKFMKGREARTLRIMSEYLHPEYFLKKYNIKNTIVFFGSARSLSSQEYKKRYEEILTQMGSANPEEILVLREKLDKLKKLDFVSRYYDDAVELSGMIAKWSATLPYQDRFYICTGGGPGMMEAANKGAFEMDEPNIGFNIELPFEQMPNPYITPELNFEFHYFFMRKFWFVYYAKAFVAMPGGMGTLDELMELLTLQQTKVVGKKMPIILYGEEFWRKLINFEYLVETGMINQEDLALFKYANSPQKAFDYIKKELTEFLENEY